MYRVLAGVNPKDPLRVMAGALDGIDSVQQVEKIKRLVAPGHSADLPSVTVDLVEYLAAQVNVGAGKSCAEDPLIAELKSLENGKRLFRRGMVGEPEPILMGHNWLDKLGRDIEHFEKTPDVAQAIEMLSTPGFSLQEGLLAQCGAKNDRGIRPGQCAEAPDQCIHRTVSEQDSTAVALDLAFVRLQRKRVGIHMTPIGMLQMGGAVDEKCRKIRLHSAIVMSEQIELQAIRESYATPFHVRL